MPSNMKMRRYNVFRLTINQIPNKLGENKLAKLITLYTNI